MRHRRTWLIASGAIVLVGVSLMLMDARPSTTEPEPPFEHGWRITVLKNGRAIQVTQHDQLPDLQLLYPKSADSESMSLIVEPLRPNSASNLFLGRHLGASDRQMIEFLLLLPPATLLICLFRNVIGLNSFGTFAPALLGLSFREVNSLLGVFVVLTIISAGWWLRRGLNELHLLQVPRTALLLSCVVVLLLGLILLLSGTGSRAVALFPLVILTGMIERFWSMEEEDGAASSLRTLATTLFLAACVWALATIPVVPRWMMRHPETLGLVMAGQLLLGRYTGFRLLELYRFRALIEAEEKIATLPPPSVRLIPLRTPRTSAVG